MTDGRMVDALAPLARFLGQNIDTMERLVALYQRHGIEKLEALANNQRVPPPSEMPPPLPDPVVPDVGGYDKVRCYFCGARHHWFFGICLGGNQ